MILPCLLLAASWLVAASNLPVAASESPQPSPSMVAPEDLYKLHCAACHQGGVPHAPHMLEFVTLGPRAIYSALTTGPMQVQAKSLSDGDKRALAEFLGGQALDAMASASLPKCDAARDRFDPGKPPVLDGWGFDAHNTRHISAGVARLSIKEVPRLRLKWAFGFPTATRARSQPTVAGETVFVGSQDGTVYAIDLATGCVRWSFQADSEVRSSPVVESRMADGWNKGALRVWFGDYRANMYALEAATGRLLWKHRVHPHPRATITGSPRYHAGRLYVPVSSTEWAAAADPAYPCCSFQGSVVALDATTGRIAWMGRSIESPVVAMRSGERTVSGPAGAPIWNSPTIDIRRGLLYVGTGEAYTSPASSTSDSVIAFDLATGAQVWHYQSIAGDAWNLACFIGVQVNCPVENGPDLDIGASPVLVTLKNGKQRLIAGQKSGDIFALDPDNGGRLLWRTKIGRGGIAGGVHWGLAARGEVIYAPVSDTVIKPEDAAQPGSPGLHALDATTGRTIWFTPAPDACAPARKPACDRGLSAPPTSIPGVVFAGSYDGHLRAYDERSGRVIWDFDTARDFPVLGGGMGRGGSIESAGPVVIDGIVLVNSGYLWGGRMGGNLLLAFSVDGR